LSRTGLARIVEGALRRCRPRQRAPL